MINIYKVLIYTTLLIALTHSCSPAPGWVPSTNQERYDAADYVVTGEVVAWSGLFPGSDAEALWLGGDLEYYKAIFPPCTNGSILVHGFKSTALCGVERFPVGTTITIFAKENPDHPTSLLLNYVSLHDGAIEGELVNVTSEDPLTTNETRACPNYTEVVAVVCTKDAMMCIDGTYVYRNASNNCEFNPCPTACMRCTKAPTTRPPPQTTTYSSEETSSSSVESSSSSESSASETGGATGCPEDLKQCPDGSYIGRDEDNNCEFFECPEGGTLNCTSDSQMCPDGRTVGRDPNNNCSFYPCPDADTKCDWCLPETKDNETEPVTVTIPEECPYLVCDICYPSGLPLGNAENSSCGYGTSRFGGYCACWSGAYGPNCTMDDAVAEAVIPYAWSDVSNLNYLNLDDSQADIHFEYNFTGHSTCSDFLMVDELTTVAPPVIELATFVNSSNLHIVISQAMVSGRAETIAYLNPGHDIGHCIYPMSDYITKEIEGCKDVFDFNIPWNLSSTCNWRILDEETHISYCGQVILQHTEWMENICEWRFVQSVLNIKIRLQKHAKVTVETVVVNNPDVTAAITNQIVLVNCPEPVLIEITTRINWPYKLDTDFNLTLSPAGKIESFSLDYDDCTSEESRSCRQRWRTALELTGTTCTLDGNYQLTFRRVLCASNDSSCPLDEEDANPVTVDYFLTSENFCAVVKVDISLSATIEVYEDANFTETRTLFLVGQTAYFRAKVTSLSNNEENPIIFSRISIKSVTIRGELVNVPVYIYENGEPQTISGATGEESVSFETITLDSTNEIGFSFELISTLINKVLRKNGKSTFIVGVEIEVSYASGQLKRGVLEVLATGTDAATFSVEAGVTDFNSNQVDAASALVLSLMLLAVIALLF